MPKKLLDQVKDKLRLKHYSIRTEHSYSSWIKRYTLFHHKRHPNEMGVREIEEFLTQLAVNMNAASSTQNQAFNALLFLYREVLGIDIGEEINAVRAKRHDWISHLKMGIEKGHCLRLGASGSALFFLGYWVTPFWP